MSSLLDALIGLLASLTAVGVIAYILTVFARILWIAIVHIWTFGVG